MKSFDVVVCLLSTDEETLSMCELVGEMVPMLRYTRRSDPAMPQVVAALTSTSSLDRYSLTRTPLVIPRHLSLALPSLINGYFSGTNL